MISETSFSVKKEPVLAQEAIASVDGSTTRFGTLNGDRSCLRRESFESDHLRRVVDGGELEEGGCEPRSRGRDVFGRIEGTRRSS